MAIIMITHDLGVVAGMVDRVIVMYAGKVVEEAPVKELFASPKHPYTEGLLGSIPKLHQTQKRLQTIEGVVPSPFNMPKGCRFHPRCKYAQPACEQAEPTLQELAPGHYAACIRHFDYRHPEPAVGAGASRKVV